MISLVDIYIPWLGDLLALGGNVLLIILLVTALMWTLIIERFIYHWFKHPKQMQVAMNLWRSRQEHQSWYARQYRQFLISRVCMPLERNIDLIKTLVILCPLLGLLGTVVGMLEVFDVMALTGSNSARSTAAGVSKATISTMAGMVVALSGLMVSVFLKRRATIFRELLGDRMPMGIINNPDVKK